MQYGNLEVFSTQVVYTTSPEMYFPGCVIDSPIFPEMCTKRQVAK